MEAWIRKIGILAGALIGVILIMFLAARVMIAADNASDTEYNEAMKKLADGSGANSDESLTGDNSGSNSEDAGNVSASESNTASKSNSEASEKTSADSDRNNSESASDDKGAQKNDEAPSEQTENTNPEGESITQTPANPEGTRYSSGDGHTIVIDAAHQQKVDTDKEPIGPGSDTTKYKITSGATGVSTGVPEYKLTLEIALALRDELVVRGYNVFMTREVNDVSMSDSERAQMANGKGEIVVHIHANADEREGITGTMAFYPSADNPFVSSRSAECKELCSNILTGLNAATGASTWGCIANDNLTALNWTKIPAAHIEVGYMSNPDEDKLMQTAEYQYSIVQGIADGIDLFFDK